MILEESVTDTIEVRWHGRGGQGTVTACKIFASACLNSGKYVQAFPEYGPERAGAPIRAYNRVSDKELRGHYPVIRPNIVVAVDATLLDNIDVSEGTSDTAIFIVNCCKNENGIRDRIKIKPAQRIITVDATRISLDTIGRPMPNAPLIGCLARESGILSLQAILDDIRRDCEKKFSREIIDGNLEATKRGFEEAAEQ